LLKSVKVCSCSQNRTVFARDQRVNIFRNETCAELGLDSSLCRNVNIAIKAQGKDQVISLSLCSCCYVAPMPLCQDVHSTANTTTFLCRYVYVVMSLL